MCGYWVPVPSGGRIYNNSIKDAYKSAAVILLGLYRNSQQTRKSMHELCKDYSDYSLHNGLPIYDTRTGKACNHWVRFYNPSKPLDGYEEVSYGYAYGVRSVAKEWPKSWLKY